MLGIQIISEAGQTSRAFTTLARCLSSSVPSSLSSEKRYKLFYYALMAPIWGIQYKICDDYRQNDEIVSGIYKDNYLSLKYETHWAHHQIHRNELDTQLKDERLVPKRLVIPWLIRSWSGWVQYLQRSCPTFTVPRTCKSLLWLDDMLNRKGISAMGFERIQKWPKFLEWKFRIMMNYHLWDST